MKTSATITVNGIPREISFSEGLTQELFYTATEETQNFILRLASAQAFIAFGKRYAEHEMKSKQIDYAAVQFPSTMSEFLAWGMASARGASPTKSALEAAEKTLEQAQAAYDKAVSAVSDYLARSDFANPELPLAHLAMKAAEAARDTAKSELEAAKAAHQAALAAKSKKAKSKKAKSVESMTKAELEAELAELEVDDDGEADDDDGEE